MDKPLPSSRPPLARMLKIHEALQDGGPTNGTKLAEELEVSTKTVMRDLAFMRDQLGLPAEYDPSTFAWRYTEPVASFPTVQVSEGELFALLVAAKALEPYEGTPFHDQLARAFEKMTAGLSDKVSFRPGGMKRDISFHHSGLGKADQHAFELLLKAVNRSLEISFRYRKPGTKDEESRRVQPYHLANRENSWYLVGFDLERKALRNFAVGRMRDIALSSRSFVRPADFSPEKHFGKAFGAFVGTGDHQVVIRFAADAAEQVQEKFWHESQDTRQLADGRLEFRVRLGGLEEILRWVLGWGGKAEVVAPAELRRLVEERARATARAHSVRPPTRAR
ncbi:MAG TPA: WYL domain-containing transcriptional regulator [Opitutaceae bacterium]|nr:WYL domain-containing transcriptional regulator [Opitutaceae bacterium]